MFKHMVWLSPGEKYSLPCDKFSSCWAEQTRIELFLSFGSWAHGPILFCYILSISRSYPMDPPSIYTPAKLSCKQRENGAVIILAVATAPRMCERKALYALFKHGWHGFHVLAEAEGLHNGTLYKPCTVGTLMPSRIRTPLLNSAWLFVLPPCTLS